MNRLLFRPEATYFALQDRLAAGQVVKITTLTEAFDFKAFRERYGKTVLLMFVIHESGQLSIVTADTPVEPRPGQTVVCLVEEKP